MDPDTTESIGIFCSDLDDDRRVVTRIAMPRNNAGGSAIPTIAGYLSSLQEISLPQNRLSEPLSGTAMGYLSNLRVLDLSSNSIPGMIPTTIGRMTSLGKFVAHKFFVPETDLVFRMRTIDCRSHLHYCSIFQRYCNFIRTIFLPVSHLRSDSIGS